MSNSNFNLNHKKKLLYKRKKQRKLFIIFIIFIIIISTITNSVTNIFTSNYNFIATIHLPQPEDEDIFTICIDPGHGDFDSGAVGNNILEKDVVLSIGLKLGELLSSHSDINVIYTRTSDSLPWLESSNDSLKERIAISDVSNSDILISLHCNNHPQDPSVKGVESWYKPNNQESEKLSQILQENLYDLQYTDNRGLKTYVDINDELAMVELPQAVASLVELGFLSNIFDARYLSSEYGQSSCAEALYKGVIEYKNSLQN